MTGLSYGALRELCNDLRRQRDNYRDEAIALRGRISELEKKLEAAERRSITGETDSNTEPELLAHSRET